MPTTTTHTFYGDVQNIAAGMTPRVYGRSYAIEAELVVPPAGAEGVIVAEADELGGSPCGSTRADSCTIVIR